MPVEDDAAYFVSFYGETPSALPRVCITDRKNGSCLIVLETRRQLRAVFEAVYDGSQKDSHVVDQLAALIMGRESVDPTKDNYKLRTRAKQLVIQESRAKPVTF